MTAVTASPSGKEFCHSCTVGKLTRINIPKVTSFAPIEALGVIHCDGYGPLDVLYESAALYFPLQINSFSKRTVVYQIKGVNEVLRRFVEIMSLAK